ncbi:hypothetical protein GCM10017781_46040 [Deinococcus metalli]|nr:hypothetical protein GCM10017781_46040 [Deinococcus metalli]
MPGVQRAYFCTPMEPGALRAAAAFATVAAEHHLESVVAMSQWLASPHHRSLHTRETWLGDQLLARLPGTAVTTLNPGFFADNDMAGLPFAAQYGLLMLPYGAGRNAPPSNEDMARVAAEILARPAGHAEQTYRPTGPALLSPQDIAGILARVLGHRVAYVDVPFPIFARVARGVGLSDFVIAQYEQYVQDYQRDAFALGAPTDVVQRITGRAPEDFETIARRYVASVPEGTRRPATQLRLLGKLTAWMLRPAPRTRPHLALGDVLDPDRLGLSAHSPDWQRSHTSATALLASGAAD